MGICIENIRAGGVRLALVACVAASAVLPVGAFANDAASGSSALTIAVGPLLPPLLEQGADGRLDGFVVDFISEAARRAELTVRFELVPDLQALRALDPAQAPLATWLLSEDPLHGYERFERGYLTLHSAVFRRRSDSASATIQAADLGEIIAVESSEAHHDLLDDGAIRVFTVATMDDAVRLLASGKHDTLFANEMAALGSIRRLGLDTVAQTPSPEMHMHQRFALHRAESRPELEAKLLPILRAMRHDGAFDSRYRARFGPLEAPAPPGRALTATAALAALGGLGLAFVLFVSRGKIRRQFAGLRVRAHEHEARLAAIMDASPTGIFRLDLDGKVTFGNQEAARITGMGEGAVDLRRWLAAIHPEDRETVAAAWKAVIDNNVSDHREYRFVHPNGDLVWVLDRGVPERDASGRIVGFLGTLTDITQLKRNEETIRTDVQILASMREAVNTTDESGTILYANAAFDALFGYAPGEVIGAHVSVLNQSSASAFHRRSDEIMAALRTRGEWSGEFRSRRKDGTEFWARARLSRLEGAGSAYAVCVQEDITEAKRAQEALRESEQRFRRVAESAMVGVALFDGTRYTYMNQALTQLLGYTASDNPDVAREDLAKILFFESELPRVFGALSLLDDGSPAAGEAQTLEDVKMRHRDGSPRWVWLGVSRLFPDRSMPRLTICVDVTARKLAEEALKESEQRFRRVAESAMVGLAIADGERYTYVNDALVELTGYGRDELSTLGRAERLSRLFGPEDATKIAEVAAGAAAAQGPVPSTTFPELRLRRKDGSIRWVSLYVSPMYADRGFPVLIVVVDISDRKRAEEALLERERMFRRTEELAKVGGWEINFENNSGGWSDELRRIHEVPEDYAPTLEAGLAFFTPEDQGTLRALAEKALTTGAPWAFEGELTTSKGRKRWVRTTGEAVRENGKVLRLVGALQDITDLKETERSLRLSEQRLRSIVDSEPECVKILDERCRLIEMNPAGLEMIGARSIDEVRERDTSELVAPEYRDAFRKSVAQVFQGHTTLHEYEIVGLQGSRRWMEQHATPLWDEHRPGRVKQMLAVTRDVTARRTAELALKESEERFRRIAESALVGVSIFDGTRFTFSNDAMIGLTGYRPEDLLGMTGPAILARIYGVSQVEKLRTALAALDGEPPLAQTVMLGELELRHKDGSLRWALLSVARLYQDQSYPRVYTCVDATDRHLAEKALRESEALFRGISEQTPDCVFLLDLDDPVTPGRILYANQAGATLHGMTVDELIGMPIARLDAPETAEHVPGRLERLRAGDTIRFEGEHRRKDGSTFPVEVVARKIPSLGGNIVLAIDRDISERRRVEAERRRIEAAMQHAQKLESLGVLTGGIAHDFNNLLMGILGNADLALRDTGPGDPARESLSQISIAAQRAADLVNQMLAYAGRASFTTRRLRVGDTIREIARLLETTLSKTAVLRYEIHDNTPDIVADPAQIQQVIMNLITNASDALGDHPGLITLRSGMEVCTAESLRAYAPNSPSEAGLFVFIEVEDSGCGMDTATLERIFDPFFSTKFTGRGLGLAATLGIVRGHRGGLRVTSTPGRGTTFRLILPAAAPEPAAIHETPPVSLPVHRRTGTLLVVDDDPRVRDFLVRALQLFGHEVLSAEDGARALEVFGRQGDRVDAVLLDLTMPVMSGEEVFCALRERRPSLPIVLISGYSDSEVRKRLAQDGQSAGFLRKPFTLDTLRETVEALLATK